MMKKLFATLIFVSLTAGTTCASDVMELKKGVTFKHKAHADTLKDCTKCHESDKGGKIAGFGKDIAHKKCKNCHTDMKMGPTNCKGCHIK